VKKQRFYFGKRKINHRNGMIGSTWVVPKMLRDYFALRICLSQVFFSLKISMNAKVGLSCNNAPIGMMGAGARKILTPEEAAELPKESVDHYTTAMLHRRKISKALDKRTHSSIQKLQAIHDEAEAFFNPPEAKAV
jgi:hypothetical protein